MNEITDAFTRLGVPAGIAAAAAVAVFYGPKIFTALGLRFRSRDEEEHNAAKQREADELRMRHNMEADIDRLRVDIKELRADHAVCEANHEQCRAELVRIRLQITGLYAVGAARQHAIDGMQAQVAGLEEERDQRDKDKDANI